MSDRTSYRRRTNRFAASFLATAVATALLAGLAPAASADTARTTLGSDLQALVDTGAVSALGEVRQDGHTRWRGSAGTADLATGAPVPARARFRIASVTKTFVATVLLQLVGEGRVQLDAPVEEYLPGEVPNGSQITVRELLTHTSGLYNYDDDPRYGLTDEASVETWLATGRWQTHRAADLVGAAFTHPPSFEPGRGWQYSNTGYLLLGMVIERVTGHSWQDEVTGRIIRPLGLHATIMPTTSPDLPGPHIDGYLNTAAGPADNTRFSPSIAGAAGAGISDAGDLSRFTAALLGGHLLRPAELAAMEQVTDTADGLHYGLGLERFDTPCGPFWGHNGSGRGYADIAASSPDGRRQFTLALTPYEKGTQAEFGKAVQQAIDDAGCATH
ncbi:serine hydrolase domain-containing protein [Kitasatospora sp. NPDC008050]|uniref:serine hydrolase domain-containing protein n=1 Tax=Kitasatospora sp. NPDC008050 TaxID=3364021 RepID=UPI0036DFF385